MKTALLFLAICYYQNKKVLVICFYARGRHNTIDLYYISHSYFHFPENTIHNISNIISLFKRTLRDIVLSFHDIAGLDMNLEEWKKLCRRA